MEDETLGEYWRAIKPILKEQNTKQREEHYDERIEYAIKQLNRHDFTDKDVEEQD